MKKSDVKRLERVVELYKRIESTLDATSVSIWASTDESLMYGSPGSEYPVKVSALVSSHWATAKDSRNGLERLVKRIKEELL